MSNISKIQIQMFTIKTTIYGILNFSLLNTNLWHYIFSNEKVVLYLNSKTKFIRNHLKASQLLCCFLLKT